MKRWPSRANLQSHEKRSADYVHKIRTGSESDQSKSQPINAESLRSSIWTVLTDHYLAGRCRSQF